MSEKELHKISCELGRIRKALEKIGMELERYNDKHQWDLPNVQTVPYTPPQGFTCWKCGSWVAPGNTHFCYGTTWAGDVNTIMSGSKTFSAGSSNDSTAVEI